MGELFDFVKSKYSQADKSETKDMMGIQRVKNTLVEICEMHIKDVGDKLTFEVLPKELPYAVAVLNEEPLKSKYNIYQASETLFVAQLKELEL